MGVKIVAMLFVAAVFVSLSAIIDAFSVEKKMVGSGCVDLLCPDTALSYGLQNLVNDETLKTDACNTCSQCTENGYSICLRVRDSRASRTVAGSCSCAHQLAANCHGDLSQTTHPANITMRLFSACYTDAIQKPPQPLAVNENSSVMVTIEPFWLEPYWRQLTVENLTLHYKFVVKNPEHCEDHLETNQRGIHTCSSSVVVDLADGNGSAKDGAQGKDSGADDYEHSENYDQYDDELPPEVQFDRDYFAGAKTFESYYTVIVSRPRQLKINAAQKNGQIFDGKNVVESEHLKFDLKPEIYGFSGRADESKNSVVTEEVQTGSTTTEVITVVGQEEDSDETVEMGGTNFFEEAEEKNVKKESNEEDENDDGAVKVNLADVKPKKLKSQEEEEEDDDVDEEEEEEEAESQSTSTIATTTTNTVTTKIASSENSTAVDDESSESSEESDDETTTIELVEAEQESEDELKDHDDQQTFLSRITNSFDFPRVRLVFLITLASFIAFILIIICLFYRDKYCCCKKKTSKTSNGYRYTTAASQPTELKPISRGNSLGVQSNDLLQNQKLLSDNEILDEFRSIVRSGTTFNPNKVELGISVGMGKFGPIYRAMFNSYNGSVHDVNVYLLKNVTRLPDDQLSSLSSQLKSNIAAGNHPNVVSLCGISQAGPDVMLMWEPLHQPTLQGVLRESRCARFGSEPFNFASFLSSERLATMSIGCCNGLEHLLKKGVYPAHLSTSNVLVAERGIVKISGFGLAEHHALNMSSENAPTKLRWMPPEHFRVTNIDQPVMINEQTIIWSLGVVLWEIFSLGGTPFSNHRQVQSFIDSMRDGSAKLETISYCGEAVTQLLSTCTSHTSEARGDLRTIIKRLECISADAKAQINLCYREDFPYIPIVTQLEQQTE